LPCVESGDLILALMVHFAESRFQKAMHSQETHTCLIFFHAVFF